jgi:hypothetical protein
MTEPIEITMKQMLKDLQALADGTLTEKPLWFGVQSRIVPSEEELALHAKISSMKVDSETAYKLAMDGAQELWNKDDE